MSTRTVFSAVLTLEEASWTLGNVHEDLDG